MRIILKIAGLLLAGLGSHATLAAPAAALGYEPKYPADFKHFEYVNPDAPKGGEIILSEMGNFDSLNPYLLKAVQAGGLGMMFDTLMTKSMDEPFSVYGLLAEDIELAADKLSVTFRLNPKAKFSNGQPVTAKDVKFSFDTLMSDKATPTYRFYWADIESCEVIDERTARFKFKHSNPELHLIITDLPVFSEAWLGGEPFDKVTKKAPIASGPYLIDSYDLGKNIIYRRNPDYWAKDLNTRRGMFNFDKIVYKYYKDQTIALEAIKAGEFEYMDIYSSKHWARDLEGPKFASKEIVKAQFPHKNNEGMQGFAFNLRRPLFQDIRVRKAISLAYDFEWANENLFYNQYIRSNSYFCNSELASSGIPQGDELALLEPFRDKLPPELFTQPWSPSSTKPPASLRDNLRQAKQLLTEAGWTLKDGVLQNAAGQKLEFEVILNQREFERILAPFADNLKKLGVNISYRSVDRALYERRMESFDYDVTVIRFSQSQSPGNEQRNMWYSAAADQEGSSNYMGVKNPVVDTLVDKIINAPDRKSLVTASRALDRVLLYGEYMVPNWYIDYHRVIYWDKFGIPAKPPLYYADAESWALSAWWKKK
jgi:microcin C transport system substrate-binding protein